MEQRGDDELVTCYDLRTGELLWEHAIKAHHHDMIGGDGPAATPTIDGDEVYALGGTKASCAVLDCITGKLL